MHWVEHSASLIYYPLFLHHITSQLYKPLVTGHKTSERNFAWIFSLTAFWDRKYIPFLRIILNPGRVTWVAETSLHIHRSAVRWYKLYITWKFAFCRAYFWLVYLFIAFATTWLHIRSTVKDFIVTYFPGNVFTYCTIN